MAGRICPIPKPAAGTQVPAGEAAARPCCTCSAAGSELCAPWQAGSRCTDEERSGEGSTALWLEQTCTGPWLCSGLDSHS